MAAVNHLAQLAADISSNVAVLTEYIEANKLPQPSFDADGPSHPIPDDSGDAAVARAALIEATKALHTLAVGPSETTIYFNLPELYFVGAMGTLCHYKIPQNVPLQGSISYAELASKTGFPENLLPRFVRMAAANYYFAEPQEGFVAHSAFSKPLAIDEKKQAAIWFRHTELIPTVAKLIDMVEQFPDSSEPTETAFHMAFGGTFFGHKETHIDHMIKFGYAMDTFTSGYSDSGEAIAKAFAWEDLPEGSLVLDIGGGTGHIAAAIAEAHPHLKFEVQDYEKLGEESKKLMASRGLSDRVGFRVHSFFEPEPVKGAAVYFFRNIFHDWSDLYCSKFLKHVVDAMGPDSRVVICDIVVPPVNTTSKIAASRVHALDLQMWSSFNAKERSEKDWEQLIASVDSRLTIEKVIGQPKMRRDSLTVLQLKK
ncbi:S-adenosyl-L-methionine-dependent methyltransferase [Bombardia bombarda]|uniref:S-adenosyl-L-methionine-dependent methyltransferase n=1 Tax=Bombardia bombarda TaxID=252184 RepID=A0AA39XNR0_9PEZI|nr:S-adenosyl-L-methionine-dependent methyltransferase [Bombardia bombarda]